MVPTEAVQVLDVPGVARKEVDRAVDRVVAHVPVREGLDLVPEDPGQVQEDRDRAPEDPVLALKDRAQVPVGLDQVQDDHVRDRGVLVQVRDHVHVVVLNLALVPDLVVDLDVRVAVPDAHAVVLDLDAVAAVPDARAVALVVGPDQLVDVLAQAQRHLVLDHGLVAAQDHPGHALDLVVNPAVDLVLAQDQNHVLDRNPDQDHVVVQYLPHLKLRKHINETF